MPEPARDSGGGTGAPSVPRLRAASERVETSVTVDQRIAGSDGHVDRLPEGGEPHGDAPPLAADRSSRRAFVTPAGPARTSEPTWRAQGVDAADRRGTWSRVAPSRERPAAYPGVSEQLVVLAPAPRLDLGAPDRPVPSAPARPPARRPGTAPLGARCGGSPNVAPGDLRDGILTPAQRRVDWLNDSAGPRARDGTRGRRTRGWTAGRKASSAIPATGDHHSGGGTRQNWRGSLPRT